MMKFFVSSFFVFFLACAHATSAWYGIQVQSMNADLRDSCGLTEPRGIIVVSIDPSSPANQVLQKGDVILTINNFDINKTQDLGLFKSAKLLHLDIWRDRKLIKRDFSIFERPLSRNIDHNILGNVDLKRTSTGVEVIVVNRPGLLRQGDKIIEINNQKITTIEDVPSALKVSEKSLSIALERNGARIVESLAINENGSFFSSQTIISN